MLTKTLNDPNAVYEVIYGTLKDALRNLAAHTTIECLILEPKVLLLINDRFELINFLSQNTEVAQFRWFAEKQGTFDLGGNTLTSGGDLVVLSDNAVHFIRLSSADQACLHSTGEHQQPCSARNTAG